MAKRDEIVEELDQILPGRVVKDVSPYLRDCWPYLSVTDEAVGNAIAAVRPWNAEEVMRLVNYARNIGIPLLVHGGGSSVTGASIPSGGLVLDMTHMNQILDVEENNRTVTVQAGAKLKDVESCLNLKGFTLGQFPQSFELATVGGYISTMGTGQYSTRYGGIEDSVLRLEIVLPSGEVTWTRKRGTPRSSVGPDLTKLFIGSEGAFGIISAAELKIRRLPRHIWKTAYTFREFETALSASRRLLELDVKPAVCRVYNEIESGFLFGNPVITTLLVYHCESEQVLRVAKDEVSQLFASEGQLTEPTLVDKWLEGRFNFREQIEVVKKMGYALDTVEVAAKWGRLLDMYRDIMNEVGKLEGVGAVGAHVSHLYDQGACVYFSILFTPAKELYWKVWETVARSVARHDATISHHHGVGHLKEKYVQSEVPGSIMKMLKKAMDPGKTLATDRFR